MLVISVIMLGLLFAVFYLLKNKISSTEKKSEHKLTRSVLPKFNNNSLDSSATYDNLIIHTRKKDDNIAKNANRTFTEKDVVSPSKPQVITFTDKSIFTGVLPPFNNNPLEDFKSVDGLDMYFGKTNGIISGYAITTYSNKGYNGKIILLIGFTNVGMINNIAVIIQNETEYMGSLITESEFKDQFNGKNPATYKLTVKNDGGDVDAISGSTISSRAFCNAVQKAYEAFIKGMKK